MSGKNNKVAIKAATIKVQPKNNTVKMAGGGSGNQTRPSKPAPVGQALPVVHGREVAGPNPIGTRANATKNIAWEAEETPVFLLCLRTML